MPDRASLPAIWIDDQVPPPNTHVAFRGIFHVAKAGVVRLRHVGSAWYRGWVDGEESFEGPLRFSPGFPEFEEVQLTLREGRHVLAVHATFRGTPYHRMHVDASPFVAIDVVDGDGDAAEVAWRALPLEGWLPPLRPVNELLGWAGRLDTRRQPALWQSRVFDDSAWKPAAMLESFAASPATIGRVQSLEVEPTLVAQGPFSERFAHQGDDLDWRFFQRDLGARQFLPTGVYRRYDLGKVRLFRPRVVLDVPAGAIVECAYSEFLVEGRVTPYILGGRAMNLDHYVARGGEQVFCPLEPRGGRYLEVHVTAPPDSVRWKSVHAIERTYFPPTQASFATSDPLLGRVWSVGVETLRSCTEDAVTDNPTRERGQWTGDSVNVGLDIAACAYHDLRPLRRALVQAALSAREDGLVAAMSAGFANYIASFAAQWTRACLRFHAITGDIGVLTELAGAALRNAGAFDARLGDGGIDQSMTWNFVDWGYVQPPGPTDLGLNLFAHDSFLALAEWGERIGDERLVARGNALAARLGAILRAWPGLADGDPAVLGYHGAALALRFGWTREDRRDRALRGLLDHWRRCFPMQPSEQPLYSPFTEARTVVTPYFAHFVLPLLVDGGMGAEARALIEACWGWMLAQGLTTWAEVFDLRWSHCHHWSGAPTWMLTRHALGLVPAAHRAVGAHDVRLRTMGLPSASGRVPLHSPRGWAEIGWERDGDAIAWRIKPDVSITLRLEDGSEVAVAAGGEARLRLAAL